MLIGGLIAALQLTRLVTPALYKWIPPGLPEMAVGQQQAAEVLVTA